MCRGGKAKTPRMGSRAGKGVGHEAHSAAQYGQLRDVIRGSRLHSVLPTLKLVVIDVVSLECHTILTPHKGDAANIRGSQRFGMLCPREKSSHEAHGERFSQYTCVYMVYRLSYCTCIVRQTDISIPSNHGNKDFIAWSCQSHRSQVQVASHHPPRTHLLPPLHAAHTAQCQIVQNSHRR